MRPCAPSAVVFDFFKGTRAYVAPPWFRISEAESGASLAFRVRRLNYGEVPVVAEGAFDSAKNISRLLEHLN